MSQMHPELVFVAGPQTGQRVVLSRPLAVLGRGAGADILFSEEYISRSQARYELLMAGPILENLSARGTWINGKRYKTGKRILLETGDLIGAGRETQILFVAAGDDPDTALAMYREYIATGKGAFGRRPQPEKVAPPPPSEPPEPEPAGEEDDQHAWGEAEPMRPSELSAAERLEAEQKARRRKIAIGLGIYLGVIIVIAIILKARSGGNDKPWPVPPRLTGDQITEFIRTPIQDITPNQRREEEELERAVNLYRQYGLSDSDRLYECFRAFKEARAYSQGYFDDPKHDRMYQAVMDKLTDTVKSRYDNAYLLEMAGEWQQAEREFNKIIHLYRDQSGGLFENIQAHYKRVKHFHQASKPKRRRWFGR